MGNEKQARISQSLPPSYGGALQHRYPRDAAPRSTQPDTEGRLPGSTPLPFAANTLTYPSTKKARPTEEGWTSWSLSAHLHGTQPSRQGEFLSENGTCSPEEEERV